MKTQTIVVEAVDRLSTNETEHQADDRMPAFGGAVTGTLIGFVSGGAPQVAVGPDHAVVHLQARSCVPLQRADVGKGVVLVFEPGDPDSPIVLGVLQGEWTDRHAQAPQAAEDRFAKEIEVDGKTIVLNAQDALILRCGEASITLARDGKIVIRGMHVVTHAEGVNRIKGGSVQLN